MRVGDRIRFVRLVERYPHFSVPKGTTGIVTMIDDQWVYARPDVEIEGLHDNDDWQGEVQICLHSRFEGGVCPDCGDHRPAPEIEVIPSERRPE